MATTIQATQPQLLQVSPICITLPPPGTGIQLKAMVSDLTHQELADVSDGSAQLNICYNGRCLSREEVSICPDPDHQIRVPVGEVSPTTASPFAEASAASDQPGSTLYLQITIHQDTCTALSPGCLTLELQSGSSSSSRALPVLLVREADIACEVIQLQQEAGTADRLLIDLGSWVASTAAASQQQQPTPAVNDISAAPASAQGPAQASVAMGNGPGTSRSASLEVVAPGLQQRETHRNIRLGLRLLAYRYVQHLFVLLQGS